MIRAQQEDAAEIEKRGRKEAAGEQWWRNKWEMATFQVLVMDNMSLRLSSATQKIVGRKIKSLLCNHLACRRARR